MPRRDRLSAPLISHQSKFSGCGPLLFGLLAVVIFVGWKWVIAGHQADIYHRQGIEISQWEVFVGVRPNEVVIQTKEAK